MSDELGFNKIAGAVLATGLAIFGLGELSNIIFEYQPPAKAGYAIAIAAEDTGGPAAAPELPRPTSTPAKRWRPSASPVTTSTRAART